MQRFKLFLLSGAMFVLPFFASAQGSFTSPEGGGGDFEILVKNILTFSDNVLIPFIIGIGFLAFVWGMFLFFIAGGANDEKKEKGKSLMIYAILGFVLIIIFWGIVNLISSSIGLEGGDIQETIPSLPTTRTSESEGLVF